MEKGLKELLENAVLSEETKNGLLEAWNSKLAEVKASLREEVEAEVRESFSLRYEQDKGNLVEAMDRMLSDTVTKYATEALEAQRALKEERSKLSAAVKEQRSEYKNRMASHAKMIESFVVNQLKEELKGITEDHQAIQAQRVKLAQEINEAKTNYGQKLNENLATLQQFVMVKLSEELGSIKEQEQALAEYKVEAAKKLREHRQALNAHMEGTKKAFIERAAKLVETSVNKQLKAEMTQLKEDIRLARENRFGRRLFEAFQAEFMTSYLSEGTQVKKLSSQLTEAKARLVNAEQKLTEKAEELNQSTRRVKIAEERATRAKVMNELLALLNKDKRSVMEELLETVKTQNLKEAFQKYLPAVLQENVRANNQGRRVLSETAPATEKKTVAVTGNRTNRLTESARSEEDQTQGSDAEILNLRRLAGIEK